MKLEPKFKKGWFPFLLALQGGIAFIFWMSALGLGFQESAVRKLNYFGVYQVFVALMFAGPICFLFFLTATFKILLSKNNQHRLKKITLVGIFVLISLQISMLTYLSV